MTNSLRRKVGQRGPFSARLVPCGLYGRMLREAREAFGVSQLDLGEISGCHRTMISRMESGERMPSRETVLQMCESLKVGSKDKLGMLIAAGYWPGQLDEYNVESAMDLDDDIKRNLGWLDA